MVCGSTRTQEFVEAEFDRAGFLLLTPGAMHEYLDTQNPYPAHKLVFIKEECGEKKPCVSFFFFLKSS